MKNYLKTILLSGAFLVLNSCSSSDDGSVTPQTQKAQVNITATVAQASESGTNGEFTLKLSRNLATETTILLKVSGSATNGVDYKTIPSTIAIAAKTNTIVLPVEILADQLVEPDETVEVTISVAQNSEVVLGAAVTASITVKDGIKVVVLTPGTAKSYMTDKNATDETVALFYNLKNIAKTSFIVGQMDAMTARYLQADASASGDTDMKKTVGYDPGMNGADFMFITDDQNDGTSSSWYYNQEKIILEGVKKAYDRGMINTFSWHLREPFEGKFFNTNQMTATAKKDAFKSILVGGVNHAYYKKKLDKVADVFNNLRGSDGKLIPVIFRPWHEFDGDWFWWGAAYSTPAEFKQNFIFTVTYLRDVKGVKNLLYAFSPDINFQNESDYLLRYPGDAYVDVLGYDNYGDFDNKGAAGVANASKRMQVISNLAKARVKIAALTETGYIIKPSAPRPFITNFFTNNLYKALTENNVEISYMAFWNNGKDSYSTPTSGSPYENDFIQFTKKDKVLLLNKMPNMYKIQ